MEWLGDGGKEGRIEKQPGGLKGILCFLSSKHSSSDNVWDIYIILCQFQATASFKHTAFSNLLAFTNLKKKRHATALPVKDLQGFNNSHSTEKLKENMQKWLNFFFQQESAKTAQGPGNVTSRDMFLNNSLHLNQSLQNTCVTFTANSKSELVEKCIEGWRESFHTFSRR